jgi:hypothetical protein
LPRTLSAQQRRRRRLRPRRSRPRRAQAQAAADAIPPEGIGNRIRHVSYSDLGGRPDSVQVMASRGHLYVGHMFSGRRHHCSTRATRAR